MKLKRILLASGLLAGVAGLLAGGAFALGWHRTPPRAVDIGALATPVTTDPTMTDDPIVAQVLLGTVYPTVVQLGTVTADGSGYAVRLRDGARVTAAQVAQALTHNRGSGSPAVKAALADVDDVSVVDARTVHISLTRPDGDLPAALSGTPGAVVVPDAGPYRIAAFTPGRSLALTRLRGSGPATLHWHFYGDAESLRTDLAGGKLDLVAPAIDIKLPAGTREVEGPAGPAILAAISPALRSDRKVADAVRTASDTTTAVLTPPGRVGRAPLVLRTTNEPDVVAAAQVVRRRLAVAGIATTIFASPPDQWRQLVDAGTYDLAVGTGLAGDKVGSLHYALIVTTRLVGTPRLDAQGALDLSTVHLR
jgi:ABC-type transport system substrate-binding protein